MSQIINFVRNVIDFDSSLEFNFLDSDELEEIFSLEDKYLNDYVIATAINKNDLVCCLANGSFIMIELDHLCDEKIFLDLKSVKPIDRGQTISFGAYEVPLDYIYGHQDMRITLNTL